MMLDFPELLAPARIVRGRTSILCSSLMDLNPATLISAMLIRCPGAPRFEALAIALPLPPRTAMRAQIECLDKRFRPADGLAEWLRGCVVGEVVVWLKRV